MERLVGGEEGFQPDAHSASGTSWHWDNDESGTAKRPSSRRCMTHSPRVLAAGDRLKDACIRAKLSMRSWIKVVLHMPVGKDQQSEETQSLPKSSEQEQAEGHLSANSSPSEPVHCRECERIRSEYEALKVKSRLEVRSFFQTSASGCCVPFGIQNALGMEALRIAQEAFYAHAHDHWPHIALELWPEGPRQISFCFADLEKRLLHTSEYQSTIRRCNEFFTMCYGKAISISGLRNATYHFNHRNTDKLDEDIQKAQDFVVTLSDETRALEIRDLRDQLQAEAVKVHTAIEDRVSRGAIGDSRGWPPHTQLSFKNVNFDAEGETHYGNFSEAMKAAALAWKKANGWPEGICCVGRRELEYRRRLETMTSRMRLGQIPSIPGATAVETQSTTSLATILRTSVQTPSDAPPETESDKSPEPRSDSSPEPESDTSLEPKSDSDTSREPESATSPDAESKTSPGPSSSNESEIQLVADAQAGADSSGSTTSHDFSLSERNMETELREENGIPIRSRSEMDQVQKPHTKIGQAKSLEALTRLNARSPYVTLASKCFVPFLFVVQVQRKALEIAQETLWNYCRTHWPQILQEIWPEGKEEVNFCMSDFRRKAASFSGKANTTKACVNAVNILDIVYDTAIQMRILRNAVAHPEHQAPSHVDTCLQKAQDMAVTVLDKDSAEEIRRLRDCVQEKAKESYVLIEVHAGSTDGGDEPELPLHVQRYLRSLPLDATGRQDKLYYAPATARAARKWGAGSGVVGGTDPEFRERVKEMASSMRLGNDSTDTDPVEEVIDGTVSEATQETDSTPETDIGAVSQSRRMHGPEELGIELIEGDIRGRSSFDNLSLPGNDFEANLEGTLRLPEAGILINLPPAGDRVPVYNRASSQTG